MGRVIVDLSVSLDGFVAGRDDGAGHPLGDGGGALFAWMGAGPESNRTDRWMAPPDASVPVIREWQEATGAMLTGRRTFDIANGWRDGHPIGAPIFVVTHVAPTTGRWSPQARFVTEGLDVALARAQELAGDRVVSVAGASLAQQLLAAGRLDAIQVSVTPVLLGGGVRLFDLMPEPVALEQERVIVSDGVTHLRYRVVTAPT